MGVGVDRADGVGVKTAAGLNGLAGDGEVVEGINSGDGEAAGVGLVPSERGRRQSAGKTERRFAGELLLSNVRYADFSTPGVRTCSARKPIPTNRAGILRKYGQRLNSSIGQGNRPGQSSVPRTRSIKLFWRKI
jgi:hypothetical protein